MRKAVIGCVLVVVLLSAGAAVASYALYHRVRSSVGSFAELATIGDLERSVRNQAAYVPPSSGELTRPQVERLLRVQALVRARLGMRADELERKYRTLLRKKEATATDMPELVSAYGDLATGFVDGKRAQVDALNDAGLSLAEYRWVRTQAYAAVGMRMDRDLAGIVEDARGGRTPATSDPGLPFGAKAPKRNQELVVPHRKALEDYVALAFFGL